MANTSFIPSSQLDFNSYKQSLKTFLQAQERFKDYDFEGSNISVLIDLLAFNTFNQAHYLNMIGSEMFLDSAQLRESIVSHAKELNYVPRSAISSRATVIVEVVPNNAPETIVIPKFYQFKTSATGGNALRFVTDQPIIISKSANNTYVSQPITVYEGVAVTEVFEVEAPNTNDSYTTYNQRFNLQSERVDISSIQVTVQQSEGDINPITYTRASSLYGLTSESTVFFIRGYKDNFYELEFGDGVLGKALSAGNIVTVTYRDTLGSAGNGLFTFYKSSTIDGYSDITVTTTSRATGGADRESELSIKYNAPRHFQVQDRAVTASDFRTLVVQNFPEIQEVSAYGGEEVAQYGKVVLVLKPHNVEGVVDTNTKNRIISFLKTKTLVPEPIIVDPEYYYLGIIGNVYYNVDSTTLRQSQILHDIITNIVALNNTSLGDFDVKVYQSTITDAIKSANDAIVGSNIKMTLIKRIIPDFGAQREYSFTLDNAIAQSLQGAYVNYEEYGVQSNVFQMLIGSTIKNVVLQDNGIGSLHLYEIIGSSKVKIAGAVGTVDYTTGEVKFSVNIYSVTPNLVITCKLVDDMIDIAKNKYIAVDSSYVDITLGEA